jgi:AcrR family transcriptional regulator
MEAGGVSRAGLDTAAVLDAAMDVVDERGPAGLTLAAVAGRCGVAAPSLYKHIDGLAELRTLLGVRVLEEIAERFAAAVMGRSGEDAVATLLREYRAYAKAYPARYAAMPPDPLGQPRLAAAGARLLQVIQAALRPWNLEGSAAIHAIRRLRVIAHGFASLESARGFGLPEDLDETYEQLIRSFLASLPDRPAT